MGKRVFRVKWTDGHEPSRTGFNSDTYTKKQAEDFVERVNRPNRPGRTNRIRYTVVEEQVSETDG